MATFFYYGLCVQDLVKPDEEFIKEQKGKSGRKKGEKGEKGEKVERVEKEEELMEFNFGVQEDEEEEMMKQAIALSLA